jgi:hypothetical protein
MFHLLVSYSGWTEGSDIVAGSRVFEYTTDSLSEKFRPARGINATLVTKLPALFASEISGPGEQHARVGTIYSAQLTPKRDIAINFAYDASIPPIANSELLRMAGELGIEQVEMSRTHWAVKESDLFKVLYRNHKSVRRKTQVFQLPNVEIIEDDLVSVMMPFNTGFDGVYEALQRAAKNANMRCKRADDIWIHDFIIQDVVSLIDRSRVVISDCTGKNPNVFYETGIAHALARDVILITQTDEDVPFDLRHRRYVKYLNNGEGLSTLSANLYRA